MTPLAHLAKNSHVTVAPKTDLPKCGATRFRWCAHIALPFPFPAKEPLCRHAEIGGREYEFSLRNHLDRLTRFPATKSTWPSVYLIGRGEPTPQDSRGLRHAREILQSVACFREMKEHADPNAAFEKAGDKVKECFQYLSEQLAAFQRSMPYLAAWQLYPISQFEVGQVYHQVEHFCPNRQKWEHLQTGITINLARQLHQPLCHLELPSESTSIAALDLSNELLAEAQGSHFRGLYRSAVINAFQAVESLANVVFKAKQVEKFALDGKPNHEAQAQAEALRFQHRMDIKFLVHQGLKAACGQSLHDGAKGKYDKLCDLKLLRNDVAHAGRKPTETESDESHQLCCEVVQWLCTVGGYPKRPLLPDRAQVASGLASLPTDINAIPNAAQAFLLWVLGAEPNSDCFRQSCQFGFRVGASPTS